MPSNLLTDHILERSCEFVWPNDSDDENSLEYVGVIPISRPLHVERVRVVIDLRPFFVILSHIGQKLLKARDVFG